MSIENVSIKWVEPPEPCSDLVSNYRLTASITEF